MDETGTASKVPKALVQNGRPDASTEERNNQDRCEVAGKQEHRTRHTKLEKEGYLDTAKFHGGKVLCQESYQVTFHVIQIGYLV